MLRLRIIRLYMFKWSPAWNCQCLVMCILPLEIQKRNNIIENNIFYHIMIYCSIFQIFLVIWPQQVILNPIMFAKGLIYFDLKTNPWSYKNFTKIVIIGFISFIFRLYRYLLAYLENSLTTFERTQLSKTN